MGPAKEWENILFPVMSISVLLTPGILTRFNAGCTRCLSADSRAASMLVMGLSWADIYKSREFRRLTVPSYPWLEESIRLDSDHTPMELFLIYMKTRVTLA